MGILDSNIVKSSGRTKWINSYWNNQTEIVDAKLSANAFDCNDYNTLQLNIAATTNPVSLEIIGYYADGGSTRYQGNIPIIEVTDFSAKPVTSFIVNIGQTKTYLIDTSRFSKIAIGKKTAIGAATVSYLLDQTYRASELLKISQENHLPKSFELVFKTKVADLYIWKNSQMPQLRGVIYNNYVWSDNNYIYLSTSGLNGNIETISLVSINFPNLLPNSTIAKIIMMPWTRNAGSEYHGRQWRMNVITSRGQVYHNFPSRATNGDGSLLPNDYKIFDESCVWDLPERWHPVKTNAGTDATLIATGKYKYFPALPDNSYELHPAINQDNGFGNGGFEATKTNVNELGESVTVSRFWRPNNLDPQDNSMEYMGGFAPNEKLTVLGTYRSNSTVGTRICVFFTNDGGRNWYCRYEFGTSGMILKSDESRISTPENNWTHQLAFVGSNVGNGTYQIRRRSQYAPDEIDKEVENTKKFKYNEPIAVTSIVGGDSITVTTSEPHNFWNGDVIVFDKLIGNSQWDWLVNEGYDDLSAGNGVIFKVKVINQNSFTLMSCVHNPHNNLTCRHIHSIDRCKDGYSISCGEQYPQGWIFYIPIQESDSFFRKYPWDTLHFIRLNSTIDSIQRGLGVQVIQDTDNTVFIGVDNEWTDLGNVALPDGRTDTFKRSSNGVFKGRMVDIDDQKLFKCVFPSPEVAFFYKYIQGVHIYIGQMGHIGISLDEGKTWIQGRIPRDMFGELSHYGGISYDRKIVIDNILIQLNG